MGDFFAELLEVVLEKGKDVARDALKEVLEDMLK